MGGIVITKKQTIKYKTEKKSRHAARHQSSCQKRSLLSLTRSHDLCFFSVYVTKTCRYLPFPPLWCPLQVKCYHRRRQTADRDGVFRLQFHTCTVHGSQLWFGKGELDQACTGGFIRLVDADDAELGKFKVQTGCSFPQSSTD